MTQEYLSKSEFCIQRSHQASSETERAAWLDIATVWLKMFAATAAYSEGLDTPVGHHTTGQAEPQPLQL